MKDLLRTLSFVAFDNDFDTNDRAWVPQIWAQETLMRLDENMVIFHRVHTDFSNEIASFGDVVNTRKPGTFTARRKGVNDDVTIQAATAVNVPVTLDQHVHTSFLIRDGEESLSWQDLVREYLDPAAKSLAEHIDRILLGQVYQFLDNQVAKDPDGSDDVKDTMLDCRKKMNDNKVPVDGRTLILTSATETEALKLDMFLSAEKVGDDGTALRKASLGEKLGFQTFMCQNASSLVSADVTTPSGNGAGDVDGGEDAGSLTVTVVTDAVNDSIGQPGKYVTFEDDGGVYRIASLTGTVLTLDRVLLSDLADDTDVNYHDTGLVDLSGHTGTSAYPAGYDKYINVSGSGVVPQVGQLVAFATAGSPDTIIAGEYCIIDVADNPENSDYYITLDRPLEVAIVDSDVVDYGPKGNYNFAFDRNAIALVVRPLAKPKEGTGALSGVSSFNNLAMRVVITYQGVGQGHLVTLDLLCGVEVLDVDRGAVMLFDVV